MLASNPLTNYVNISLGVNCLMLNTQSLSIAKIPTDKPDFSHKLKTQDKTRQSCGTILAAGFSNSGRLFCVCDDYKRVVLYGLVKDDCGDTEDWRVLGMHSVPRRCSCILFDPGDLHVLVGDKSGSVYRLPVADRWISVGEAEEDGALLLGHVSMMTDLCLSPCNRFLATADRDEKIRISHFPKAYNIEAFCLGHGKFVTQVVFLPDGEHLLSGGGDGTLRLWRFKTGELVDSVDFACYLRDLQQTSETDDAAIGDARILIVSRLYVRGDLIVVAFNRSPLLLTARIDWCGDCPSHSGQQTRPRLRLQSRHAGTSSSDSVVVDVTSLDCTSKGGFSLLALVGLMGPQKTPGDGVDGKQLCPLRLRISKWRVDEAGNWTEEAIPDSTNNFLSTIIAESCGAGTANETQEECLLPRTTFLSALFKSPVDRPGVRLYEESKVKRQKVLSQRRRRRQQRRNEKDSRQDKDCCVDDESDDDSSS